METLGLRVPEKPRKTGEPRPPSPPRLAIEAAGQKFASFGFGRPYGRGWRAHTRDQPPRPSRVGMPREALPTIFRRATNTVETQGTTAERGGDGTSAI